MATFFGYIRVSTKGQKEGRRAQEDAIRARFPEARIFTDAGVSGGTGLDRRPALLELLSMMKKGDTLVVAKRDRLGRDPIVVAMIEASVERKGGKIISCAGEGTESNDPASILMRRMVDAFAEYERLIIKARTKNALQAKKKKGERAGSIPLGYRLAKDGVRLEEDEEEQKVLRRIKALHGRGYSVRKIAERLNEEGVPARGKKWHHTTVHRVLKAA